MENGLACMWISLLVGLLSCAERPALDFDSIERIMPQQPDSALLRLDTAHVDPLRLSDADRAHYYLLLTEALDKCYQTPRSDSLISAAIHYYKGKHDPNRLAKTWYYKGRILQDQNMPLQAQDAYLEASNVVGVTDYSLLARLYNHLGSLYLYQDVYEKAIDFLRKAYFYYEKIEHQNGLSSVQVNMARAFHGLGAIDSAQYYYERLLPLAQGTRIRTLPSELGDLYREQGAMDKVYPLMQLALEWQPKEEKRAPIYLALGEYFLAAAGITDQQDRGVRFCSLTSLGNTTTKDVAFTDNAGKRIFPGRGIKLFLTIQSILQGNIALYHILEFRHIPLNGVSTDQTTALINRSGVAQLHDLFTIDIVGKLLINHRSFCS